MSCSTPLRGNIVYFSRQRDVSDNFRDAKPVEGSLDNFLIWHIIMTLFSVVVVKFPVGGDGVEISESSRSSNIF